MKVKYNDFTINLKGEEIKPFRSLAKPKPAPDLKGFACFVKLMRLKKTDLVGHFRYGNYYFLSIFLAAMKSIFIVSFWMACINFAFAGADVKSDTSVMPCKLRITVTDKETRLPIDSAEIKVFDANGVVECCAFTDHNGIADAFLKEGVDHKLVARKEVKIGSYVYLSHSQSIRKTATLCSCSIDLEKIEEIIDYSLRPVHFKFNSLVFDDTAELKVISNAFKENPDLSLEVGGHSDCRGNKAANMIISQKRANIVAAFLVAHGINRNHIAIKAYGDERPLNGCDCKTEAVKKCTDEMYSYNRRVDFKILSYAK